MASVIPFFFVLEIIFTFVIARRPCDVAINDCEQRDFQMSVAIDREESTIQQGSNVIATSSNSSQ